MATHETQRLCARRGCTEPVKKRTAKYCSVRCCAVDPERHERLRVQARRASPPLPMTRQLSLSLNAPVFDPEALLAQLRSGHEDVPEGMARFAG